MKKIIKIISIILVSIMCLNQYLSICAHQSVLNVEYDDCNPPTNASGTIKPNQDGDDEMWYSIANINTEDKTHPENNIYCEYHLNESITTIRYYFADSAENDPNYKWTTDIYKEYIKTMSYDEAMAKSEETAEEIKEAYANSMKKWNNIYYFSYDENGNATSHKLINIVEATEESTSNLVIYPIDYYSCKNGASITLANTGTAGGETLLDTTAIGMLHRHYTHWNMNVNVSVFFAHSKIEGATDEYDIPAYMQMIVNKYREFVGAHELGHVLGLWDVDLLCSEKDNEDHHEELLMGYGNGDRSTYAKYKDIAGVSITRGFHTDADHVWMLRTNTNGTHDVICAQCNGVRYNVTLSIDDNNVTYGGKQLNIYKSCVHHGGTNENMLLVATDGTRNFFKCQYCRHIEEVDISAFSTATKYSGFVYTNTVLANQEKYYKVVVSNSETYTLKSDVSGLFTIELYDSSLNNTHKISNDIFGADGCAVSLTAGTYYLRIKNNSSYSITSNISFSPPPHIHNYTEWAPYSLTQHIECCECGAKGTIKKNHVVTSSGSLGGKANCILCGALVDLGLGFGESIIQNIQKVTINGSYILPNGIIVLVDEDIEAYLNGTLVFYAKDNLPQVQ